MKPLFNKNPIQVFFDRYYQFVQHLWVLKMNALTKGLSKKKLAYGLMVFIVISGSVFIYKIAQVFSNKIPVSLKIPAVSKPLAVGEKNQDQVSIIAFLSKAELERLNSFRYYLDSLSKDKEGRKIYDSIEQNRPGLLDSLTFMEEYYTINFKKE